MKPLLPTGRRCRLQLGLAKGKESEETHHDAYRETGRKTVDAANRKVRRKIRRRLSTTTTTTATAHGYVSQSQTSSGTSHYLRRHRDFGT